MKKFWKLFHDNDNQFNVVDDEPSKAEFKVLHKTIKKIEDDNERFSFNTAVSGFMICVNELNDLKCNKRQILEPLTILLSAYAPHIAEELWHLLGHETSVVDAAFPQFNEEYLKETSFNYPISFNGKTRFQREFPLDMTPKDIEAAILADEEAQKWIEGRTPKKVIIVPKKIVNIVL